MQLSGEYLFVFKFKITVLRKCNVVFYSSAHGLLFISHQMRAALPLALAVLQFCATPLNSVPTPDLTAEENSEFCSHPYNLKGQFTPDTFLMQFLTCSRGASHATVTHISIHTSCDRGSLDLQLHCCDQDIAAIEDDKAFYALVHCLVPCFTEI